MFNSKAARLSLAGAVAAMALTGAVPADAARCKRINKTGGAAIGAVGGAVLGNVIFGGTGGTLVGAAAGGVAGHEIARKKYNKNCGRSYRRR